MFAGKSAVVTGSTSGIGLGIARALAKSGCNIMLNGFGDALVIEQERRRISSEFGVEARFGQADLSTPGDVLELISSTITQFGNVDILVNNAGIQHTAKIEDFPADRWDAIIAINLSASFHATRAALPAMRKRNWGRIVNIASTHGLIGSVEKSAYVAAKHGVVGLTKVVALETATTGITCNAICPGWVLTPLVEGQIKRKAELEHTSIEQAKSNLLAGKQPSHEFVTTEQIGDLVVFLCSESAAQIRGAALCVDGGWTAQ